MSLFYVALSPRSRRYIFFFRCYISDGNDAFRCVKTSSGNRSLETLIPIETIRVEREMKRESSVRQRDCPFLEEEYSSSSSSSRASLENISHSRIFASEIRFRNLGSGSYFLSFFFFSYRKRVTTTCDLPICSFFFIFIFFYVKNLHQEIDDYVNIARENDQICNFVGLSLLN